MLKLFRPVTQTTVIRFSSTLLLHLPDLALPLPFYSNLPGQPLALIEPRHNGVEGYSVDFFTSVKDFPVWREIQSFTRFATHHSVLIPDNNQKRKKEEKGRKRGWEKNEYVTCTYRKYIYKHAVNNIQTMSACKSIANTPNYLLNATFTSLTMKEHSSPVSLYGPKSSSMMRLWRLMYSSSSLVKIFSTSF